MCGLVRKKNAKLLEVLEYNGRLLGALLMMIKQDSLINKSISKQVSDGISGLNGQSVFGRRGRTCDGREDGEGKDM